MATDEWAVPYVPCGCGPVLRTQACGDYEAPRRWYRPPRCAKCGHVDVPCHHVKVMEAMGTILFDNDNDSRPAWHATPDVAWQWRRM